MGTCTNWYTCILTTLNSIPSLQSPSPQSDDSDPTSISTATFFSQLAKDWRAGVFKEIHARFETGQLAEDIDVTYRRVLDGLLGERGVGGEWDEGVREVLVRAWHQQFAWDDAVEALERLKKQFFVVVLANGTTRLQLDIIQFFGLPFHTLLSSQLLGLTKPDPAIYLKTAELLQLQPEECMMVAAHAYDLRAAKKVTYIESIDNGQHFPSIDPQAELNFVNYYRGFKTAYIHRLTEDLDEDMDVIRGEVDLLFDGRENGDGSKVCGLTGLADYLESFGREEV